MKPTRPFTLCALLAAAGLPGCTSPAVAPRAATQLPTPNTSSSAQGEPTTTQWPTSAAPAPATGVDTGAGEVAIADAALEPIHSGSLATEKDAQQHLLSKLHVGFYAPRHKNNKDYPAGGGYLAPVARTSDGGFVFGGQAPVKGKATPVIGKIDGDGALLWQVPLDHAPYRAYEGGLVNETPDGNYVGFVMGYINEALNPTLTFAKVTPSGALVWKLELPRDKHGNSAQVHLAKVAADGSIGIRGHIYVGPRRTTDRPAYSWTARITADGILRDEAAGPPLDWAKDEW